VKQITGGKGVPVVYDSVGKDTYPASLDCLKSHGLFVVFGAASGPIPPVDSMLLMRKGSLMMTRMSVYHYLETPAAFARAARDLFRIVLSGKVKIRVNQTYALKDAARCHQDMAERKTTGSSVLIP
jgi:NADPH2:quinone reductase